MFLAIAEYQILGSKHCLRLGLESGKIWWLNQVQYLHKKYHCRWNFLRAKKPKWIFQNPGDILQPLEFVPISRERVVPSRWQVRPVLGVCLSKARVISIQASQCRQFALICDLLDLAKLSIREEATLATNWIKHRPGWLKLQNLALATITGRAWARGNN